MGYDIDNASGYVIDAKELLSGFPTLLEQFVQKYPPAGSEGWVWGDLLGFFETTLCDFVRSEIHEDLGYSISICGSWYGDFPSGCPFETDEVFVVFGRWVLIDETREIGKSGVRESELFVHLNKFLDDHGVTHALRYEEWSCGG